MSHLGRSVTTAIEAESARSHSMSLQLPVAERGGAVLDRRPLVIGAVLAIGVLAAMAASFFVDYLQLPALGTWLWVALAVLAAAAQTARNATQRELTAILGTIGATHVRFLFGLPFALVFLAAVPLVTGAEFPRPQPVFWAWAAGAALAQILATAMMLAAMSDRTFAATIAYIKTEPIYLALFGFVVLGEQLTIPTVTAIIIATAGVILMSLKPAQSSSWGYRQSLLGLGAAIVFALTTVAHRGTILSLNEPNFVMGATFALVVVFVIQVVLLSIYLAIRDRAVLVAIVGAWRASLLAGATGALASEFLFLAYAIASAASVRTLTLVEVLFSQAVSYFILKQASSSRELTGMAVVVIGVALLIWSRQ